MRSNLKFIRNFDNTAEIANIPKVPIAKLNNEKLNHLNARSTETKMNLRSYLSNQIDSFNDQLKTLDKLNADILQEMTRKVPAENDTIFFDSFEIWKENPAEKKNIEIVKEYVVSQEPYFKKFHQ